MIFRYSTKMACFTIFLVILKMVLRSIVFMNQSSIDRHYHGCICGETHGCNHGCSQHKLVSLISHTYRNHKFTTKFRTCVFHNKSYLSKLTFQHFNFSQILTFPLFIFDHFYIIDSIDVSLIDFFFFQIMSSRTNVLVIVLVM